MASLVLPVPSLPFWSLRSYLVPVLPFATLTLFLTVHFSRLPFFGLLYVLRSMLCVKALLFLMVLLSQVMLRVLWLPLRLKKPLSLALLFPHALLHVLWLPPRVKMPLSPPS